MGKFFSAGLVVAAMAVATSVATVAEDEKKGAPAVGAGTWNQTVTKEPAVAGVSLDPQQIDAVKKVSNYFNELTTLKGAFVQTSADNKRLRGKFYVKKPGRFRFDYALPSKMIIISDGSQLAIQDTDIKSDDRIPLEQTPFRLLLRENVDILRDARVSEVLEAEDLIVVSLRDKSPDAPGLIKLFLVKKPGLELKEWVTTDAQGLDTRVEVSELIKAEKLDPELFKPTAVSLQKIQ